MAEKKPNLHKTLLILIAVFLPPFWLIFTDEGSRVSDTTLLWLLGETDIRVDLGKLDSRFSQEDIRKVYSENEWQCGPQSTPFGDELCVARIGTFNGYPSQAITFYFREGRVSSVKLIYRDQYHQQILGFNIEQFGQPSNVAAAIADGPDADEVLEWDLEHGVMVMKKTLGKSDEPALLWMASGDT
jgi:hypothetical protein